MDKYRVEEPRYWYRRKMVTRCRGSTVVPRNTTVCDALRYSTPQEVRNVFSIGVIVAIDFTQFT